MNDTTRAGAITRQDFIKITATAGEGLLVSASPVFVALGASWK